MFVLKLYHFFEKSIRIIMQFIDIFLNIKAKQKKTPV